MTDFNMPPGVSARDIPGQDDDETGSPHPITDQWAGLAKLMAPNAVVVGAALARSLESDLAAANDEITRLRAEVATMTNDYFRRHRECGDMAQEVIRLRAEVEALRAATPWQPIETAPRDGTEILVYTCSGCFYVVSYDDIYSAPWRVINSEGFREHVPTHWMPLPPPPTGHAKEKE